MIRHLQRLLRALNDELVKVEHSASTANVHRARKAARVLRDAAAATKGVRLTRLKAETDHLKHALGAVRDLQLRGVSRSAGLQPALVQLRTASRRWRKHQSSLERELAKASSPSSKQLRRALRRRLGHLSRRIVRLPPSTPPKAAHRLRMRIKRAHTIVGLVDGESRRLLATLQRASAALGDLHDFDAHLQARGKTRRHWAARARRVLAEVERAVRLVNG